MSAFEQVDLKDITAPIPPEASFDWWGPGVVAAVAVVFIVLALIAFKTRFQWGRIFNRSRALNISAQTDKLIKQLESGKPEATPEACWKNLLEIFRSKGWIGREPNETEAVRQILEGREDLSLSLKKELVDLINRYELYQYSEDAQVDRAQILELFRNTFRKSIR